MFKEEEFKTEYTDLVIYLQDGENHGTYDSNLYDYIKMFSNDNNDHLCQHNSLF